MAKPRSEQSVPTCSERAGTRHQRARVKKCVKGGPGDLERCESGSDTLVTKSAKSAPGERFVTVVGGYVVCRVSDVEKAKA